MAANVRQRSRINWPRGLREVRPGYFAWEPPADVLPFLDSTPPAGGFVLGRITLQQAIAQVTEAYLHLHGKMQQKRLIHTVQSAPDRVSEWIPTYLERVKAREVKADTIATARRYLAKITPILGHIAVPAITTRHIADYLATLASTPRTQQATRSLLLDLFREAVAAGWRSDNPVSPTRSERVQTQRGRLSLEHFVAIHAWSNAHQPAWATRAIELGIVTAQRRADIAALTFAQARDGHLWVQQGKCGAKVAIPLGLRLNVVWLAVGDVVAACRDGALSRWLVHHSVSMGRAKSGAKVRDTTIGQAFAEARDGAGVVVAGKTPPTFHELRSLSLRLYHDQGINAQALAGHKSADMTSVYRDVRGDEWVKVSQRMREGK